MEEEGPEEVPYATCAVEPSGSGAMQTDYNEYVTPDVVEPASDVLSTDADLSGDPVLARIQSELFGSTRAGTSVPACPAGIGGNASASFSECIARGGPRGRR